MSVKRTLRIFCPVHEASFEVSGKSKILCEITGHTLSTNFPHGEQWEFCCNCETWSPSKLGKGEAARGTCFSCQNEITSRFACDQCKTFSFECGTKARGKSYFITDKGIEPSCPGCQSAVPLHGLVRHDCEDVGAPFFTAHETCPFCLEKTAPQNGSASEADLQVCPQCNSGIREGATFCPKCRHRLRMDAVVDKLGTDTIKSKVLGSLCPTCSTPIPPDSEFCGECGQAVIAAIPPPPPPPPKKKPIGVGGATATSAVAGANDLPIIATPKAASTQKAFAAIGIVLFIVIAISLGLNMRTSTQTGNNSSSTNSNNSRANNSYSSNSTTGLPSNFVWDCTGRIGKKNMAISMHLVKTGSELNGYASTSKTDVLKGTIDTYGKFELNGYEEGNEYMESRYSGSISTEGRIVGTWTRADGGSRSSFDLTRTN